MRIKNGSGITKKGMKKNEGPFRHSPNLFVYSHLERTVTRALSVSMSEGDTVGTVDQVIIDNLHPTGDDGTVSASGVGSIQSQGFEEDDVPSVESLSEADEDDVKVESETADPRGDGTESNTVLNEGVSSANEQTNENTSQDSPANVAGPSAWDQDAYLNTSLTDDSMRKRTILRELEECAPDIVQRYGLSVNDSSLTTLQYELDQFHTKQQLDTQVKFLELGLMSMCYGIEFVNRKVLQGFLSLDGWGDNTSKSLGQFRSCLRRIAIRYFTTRRERSEIMELGMLILGHMAWYHFQNTSRSVWEKVNRNPQTSQRPRRRRAHNKKRREGRSTAGTGDAAAAHDAKTESADAKAEPDAGPSAPMSQEEIDDASSSSSEDDVDEDLEAAPITPGKAGINLLGMLSQLV